MGFITRVNSVIQIKVLDRLHQLKAFIDRLLYYFQISPNFKQQGPNFLFFATNIKELTKCPLHICKTLTKNADGDHSHQLHLCAKWLHGNPNPVF